MGKSSKGNGSSSSGSKDSMLEIDPECIRFTHARIRPFFTGCGRRIEDTLADIIEGKISVNDLPKITVILNEGTYFSLNNRRLYVLKELRCKGLLKGNMIGARLKVALDREKDKYKIERCSLFAKIMRENAVADKCEAGEVGVDDYDKSDDEVDKEFEDKKWPQPTRIEKKSHIKYVPDELINEVKGMNIKRKKGNSKRNKSSDDEM